VIWKKEIFNQQKKNKKIQKKKDFFFENFSCFRNLDVRHYEQKIRNLEYENQELRSETLQLKIDSENYENQEQTIVDNFVNALGKIFRFNKKNINLFLLFKLMQMLK